MEKDIVDRLMEFAEANKEKMALSLLLRKMAKQLKDNEEEIARLREEVVSYRNKLKEVVKLELASESVNPILKVHIMECGLPLYVARDLYCSKYSFDNLGEVVRFTRKELLGIRGFGGKRMAVLEGFLEKNGLKLAEE